MTSKLFIGLVLSFFICANVTAQEDATSMQKGNKWEFLVEPYLLLPNMNGEVGIGNLPNAEADANIGDIFSNLKFGFMLNAEATNGTWAVASDFIYMDLGADVLERRLITGGEVGATQIAWEGSGFRRLNPWLEVGLGAMINTVSADLDLTITQIIGGEESNVSASSSNTWFEPMLIARVRNKPEAKFIYTVRGEIGGFGIGSDFAWQLQAYAGYRFTKLFQMTAGYRVISLDYETGSGQDRFLYDVTTSGPVISFGFNF
ncbi:hypothetical protein [Robiginitalea sp.]|uniref:hypothetical protein n=1 Tax=Robiginitalea sp. TaxID=1902411 RepID=UPI003C723A69